MDLMVTITNKCDICGKTDCVHLCQRLAAYAKEEEEDKIVRGQSAVANTLRRLRIAENKNWILGQIKDIRLKKERAALAIRLDRCYGLAIALKLVGRKRSFEIFKNLLDGDARTLTTEQIEVIFAETIRLGRI